MQVDVVNAEEANVLPAVTFDDILSRAPAWGTPEEPLGQRLISIVFACPSSPVWQDLTTNRAFLDARSGNAWDLFFAGMSGYCGMEIGSQQLVGGTQECPLFMNPRAFREIEEAVYRGLLRASNSTPSKRAPEWRYSGDTDLVSFMCYAREPDWASLSYVCVDELSTGRFHTLGRITEELTHWRDDDIDPTLAPGIRWSNADGQYGLALSRALTWTASAVAGGVMGNSVHDLLRELFGR